ncbi:Thiamine-phosphate synthase [bacterium HR30]|nr:Thiamine-phosphate synthase [bacterium HR30]
MQRAPRLYLVTDRRRTHGRDLLEVVEAALSGGVDGVQLREKDLPAREQYELARRLRPLCERHGAMLLINDRIDVALAVKAHGVHLPVRSFLPSEARQILGSQAIIGASCHDLKEALRAAESGADFLVCGPVFPTPSKGNLASPLGVPALAAIARAVPLPVLAIGGVTQEAIPAIRAAGAHGAAVIRAILEAADPRETARDLVQKLTNA